MGNSDAQAAVLYADVSGSTRLYEKFGDAIARADIATCIGILTDVVKRYEGRIAKTIGDEAMCIFPDAAGAALAAREMQLAVTEAGDDESFKSGPLRIKIGWHFGTIGGADDNPTGEAPTLAQQIIKLAKPSENLTSGQSMKMLPPELRMSARIINKIRAEGTGEELEVYALPWEIEDDVTSLAGAVPFEQVVGHRALVLEHRDRTYLVEKATPGFTVGRSASNDLHVDSQHASRRHAVITYKNGRYHLKDESVNGTVVVDSDGRVMKLRREEAILMGSGVIGFGGPPDEEPEVVVRYRCE
jgi:class 3 adenylate cyclase